MLPDISGDEIEQFLVEHQLVGQNNAPVGVPTNAPCTDEQHAAMASGSAPLNFKPRA